MDNQNTAGMNHTAENNPQDFIILHAPLPAQEGGDETRFSEIMVRAFENGATKVIFVCSNTSDIQPDEQRRALQLLDNVDIVLGPTTGGGLYLIGMRRLKSEHIPEIEWRAEDAFEKALMAVCRVGISCRLLPNKA
jgi:glycosyltransferase A (GT-A) superfamily protein (DUF2064 family)